MLNIKKIIKNKGYSVSSLAEKIGMKQVSLSRIINGNPTVETLNKIATALDVDVREFFISSKGGEVINGFVEYKGVVHRVLSRKDLEALIDLIDETS